MEQKSNRERQRSLYAFRCTCFKDVSIFVVSLDVSIQFSLDFLSSKTLPTCSGAPSTSSNAGKEELALSGRTGASLERGVANGMSMKFLVFMVLWNLMVELRRNYSARIPLNDSRGQIKRFGARERPRNCTLARKSDSQRVSRSLF